MKTNVFLSLCVVPLLTSCSAKLTSSIQKTYAPLAYEEEVRVFEINEETPLNAEKLGTVKIGDSGFSTNCNYTVVLDKAKAESRRVGGNALKITQHQLPDLWSSCHRITADVLKIDGTEKYLSVAGTAVDSTLTGAEQAIAPVYKPNKQGTLEIFIDDTLRSSIPRFRIAIDGGWQYRTAKLADGLNSELKKHYKKMKAGFHYDLQAAYFFTESMGVEAIFSQQFFGNNLGNGTLTDAFPLVSGTWDEKMVLNYIGANYILRHFDAKRKNCWLFSVGFGYLGYNDKLLLDNVEYLKMTAGTFGTNMAIGYDIGLSENLAIGFKLALRGGTFRKFKQTQNGITTNETLPDETFEGLGTLKLSVGLRFNK
ncbi:MAG: porin family protein [Culturomica sp.]|jgi:hypothetical protein|nr:porin family protein [Culturomica sp.]